ncbi:TIGR03915 family putative DNA repair protein [Scatolibacter rhodanostii]|uniref:TIGR03915 family putative DNA repair protein n=1 Tax=Scatolibacter rhodanostii TaxID=2014781 RepID=UPI000C08554B|nr:TIGR03915 family putative DNA repair protein [Scatolibacter rhodanostii]
MLEWSNIVYQYDGSYDGFLCCVFESFLAKENPADIILHDEQQETLFPVKYIETDDVRAGRVKRSIPLKMSQEAEDIVKRAFLSCMEHKETKILAFLRLGYQVGAKVTKLSTHDVVHTIDKAVKFVGNEAHLSLEFLRFSEFGEFLGAEITPKNNILPLITYHFCDRFPDENFVIYDKNHQIAFLHKGDGTTEYLYGNVTFPDPDEEEESYRRLWKHFYETIAIEGRRNERCRMNHMPKRYWPNMTEFKA